MALLAPGPKECYHLRDPEGMVWCEALCASSDLMALAAHHMEVQASRGRCMRLSWSVRVRGEGGVRARWTSASESWDASEGCRGPL